MSRVALCLGLCCFSGAGCPKHPVSKNREGTVVLVRFSEETGKVSSSSFSSVKEPQLTNDQCPVLCCRNEEISPFQGDSFYAGLPHASLCLVSRCRDGKSAERELGTRLSSSDSLARLVIADEMWGEGEQGFKWCSEKLGLSEKFLPGTAKEAEVEVKGQVGLHPYQMIIVRILCFRRWALNI